MSQNQGCKSQAWQTNTKESSMDQNSPLLLNYYPMTENSMNDYQRQIHHEDDPIILDNPQ